MGDDQAAVIAFLASPRAHGGAPVERVETHASIVFLAGDRALKLKRAVRYDYLDFSTEERRRACCEAEVRVNRRTAADLYRGVRAVTREPGGALALDGGGEAVDWVVEMARFDQDQLLDRLAERGALDLALMRPLGRRIAAFHAAATPRRDHGGAAGMAWVIDGNLADLRTHGAGALDAAAVEALATASQAALDRQGSRLDRRRAAGLVRQGHGDLHLRNIVRLRGEPTLFDAVEFNDEIACTDVLYDLAFLLMDLWRRRLWRHANAVLNGYMAEALDPDGLALLPLFQSCRAAVRAKTSLAAAALQSGERQAALRAQAAQYLDLAVALLQPPGPCVVAVGGLSGTGKSTLARALAPLVGPAPGAVIVRSDEQRKRICGVPELTPLGPDGYTAEISRRVYAAVTDAAAAVARAGHAAVADAVFARAEDRVGIEAAVSAAAAPFAGIWLDAPAETLLDRAARRGADASDADALVIRAQLAQDPGPVSWAHVSAAQPADAVLSAARQALPDRVPLVR